MQSEVTIHPSYFSWQKRMFDSGLSLFFSLLLLPFFILTWPVLFLAHGWPIIFKQQRVGQDGKIFTMYKLRSMNLKAKWQQSHQVKELKKLNYAPEPMLKIVNDPRFTKIGRWLSHSGLDELPQLINILKGEMSFVGPRPLPKKEALELKKIKPAWFQWRHAVRPGVFSVWTFDDRRHQSLIMWQQLDHQTLALDFHKQWQMLLKIGLKQLNKVFSFRNNGS